MNQSESEVWEDDGELAAFSEEMQRDAPLLHAILARGHAYYPVKINYHTVRAMVKAHNEMAALLREYAARHPEDTDLARRANHYL